jgi:uncharacterized protein YggT (Ycf19 family)
MDIAILIIASLSLLADLLIAALLVAFFACWWNRKPSSQSNDLLNQIRAGLPMAIQRQRAPIAPAPETSP